MNHRVVLFPISILLEVKMYVFIFYFDQLFILINFKKLVNFIVIILFLPISICFLVKYFILHLAILLLFHLMLSFFL